MLTPCTCHERTYLSRRRFEVIRLELAVTRHRFGLFGYLSQTGRKSATGVASWAMDFPWRGIDWKD